MRNALIETFCVPRIHATCLIHLVTVLVIRIGVFTATFSGTGNDFSFLVSALFSSTTSTFVFTFVFIRIGVVFTGGAGLAFLTFPSPTTTILVVFVIRIGFACRWGFPACRSRTNFRRVIFRVKVRARDVLASSWIKTATGLHLEAHFIPRFAANRNALQKTFLKGW